jgi:hypothetical protein
MSAVPKKYFSPEEYLALERAATCKSEYYQGEIFPMGDLPGSTAEAMAGATLAHNTITENLSGL